MLSHSLNGYFENLSFLEIILENGSDESKLYLLNKDLVRSV